MTVSPPKDAHSLLQDIQTLLEDKKASDCITIDLRGKGHFCDYFVIASAPVGRHLNALAEYTGRCFKDHGIVPSVEGLGQGEWVLVDGGDIVVHLFLPSVRAHYNLEKMWI